MTARPASLRIAATLLMAGPACAQTLPDAGQTAVAPVRPVGATLINARAIAPFLTKLPQARTSTPPLSVVQIGDSHTAGDMFTNGWRKRWQAEYGSGGRGMSAVGRPYQGYLTWGVTARQSPEWVTNALFGKARVADGPLLGLSGFTTSAQHAGAWLQLRADGPGFTFDQFSLCGLTGPDKGTVRIAMTPASPGAVETARNTSFAAEVPGATCVNLAAPAPANAVSITTLDDRPVNLTSWSSTRQTGGVIVSNLGVVGARLGHFTRNDDQVLALELRQARPDLLAVAFGTNEGFDPSLKLDEAEAVIRTQIDRLRRLLGHDVPIVLIGPPDAASSRPEVALPGMAETVNCGGGWYVPGNLARVRQLQIRLAQTLHLAFWDWQSAMGGPCSSMRWVAQGLQRGDHVHFTVDGGRLLGDALAADLDQAGANLAP
jgi:lysophospholipase L1-like esterase